MSRAPEQFAKMPGYSDDYNSLPFTQNIEPFSPVQFLHLLHIYGMRFPSDLRQPTRLDGLPAGLKGSVHCIYVRTDMDMYVIYMAYDWQAKGISQYPMWRAGCKHEFVDRIDTQRGWHKGTCKHCGFKYEYDSGD